MNGSWRTEMNPKKDRSVFVPRNIVSLRRMAGTAVMTVAMLFTQVAVSTTYNYRVTDPMVGNEVAELNTAFWEPWIGVGGNGGESEQGYVSISDDGFVLGSFNVNLGFGPGMVPKWVLEGDFRVSFFLQTSPDPGGYGNRLGAFIYELTPVCGAYIYPYGYAGLWMGYSAPEAGLYYPLQYDEPAYFLFVKEGGTVTIYKGDDEGVTEDPANWVFSGDYLNPTGQFLFGLSTGHPNSGWMRVRDVVIDTEGLLACDGSPIPPEWIAMDNDTDGDGFANDVDNCPEVANASQSDFDDDGAGDACDEDVDGDGALNAADICPLTRRGAVVRPDTGCSIAQLCPCEGAWGTGTAWKNHSAYVSCVAPSTNDFVKRGLITAWQAYHQVGAAVRSSCGKRYYCRDPKGYFPDVWRCPGGWEKVPPKPE
jgi:hypothetical protein